jgi:hypothetical protein
LDLQDTKITDAGLEYLRVLSKLRSLDVEGTKATRKGVQKLLKTLPKLKIVYSPK